MKIKYASIKVKNIEKSLSFYRKILGLDVVDEYYSDTVSVVMLTDGYFNLELIEDSSDDCGLNNIGFVVDDIEDVLNRLEESDIVYEDDVVTEDNHILSLTDYDGVNINIMEK